MTDVMNGADVLKPYLNGKENLSGNEAEIHSYDL